MKVLTLENRQIEVAMLAGNPGCTTATTTSVVAALAGNPGCATATTTTVVAALAGNPGCTTATTTTVVATLAGNPNFNDATTTPVVAGIVVNFIPTPADHRSSVADRCSTAISFLQTRGNLPLRNLGHVLD